MNKIAHTELYMEALEKVAKERKKSRLGHTLSTAKGALGGGIVGGASGSMLGGGLAHLANKRLAKSTASKAEKALGPILHDIAGVGGLGLLGLLAGAGLGGRYGYKKYKEHFSKKEAHDRGYREALEKVAKKYSKKDEEIGTAGNVGAALLGPFQAFGAPEGRRLRTAGHMLGKAMLGNLSGSAVGLLVGAATKNPELGAAMAAALGRVGAAVGNVHGYHTGKKGRKFFDSMGA